MSSSITSGRIVGQSCYLDIRTADRGIEIGGTWYSPMAQGTRVNPAAKLLLIDHAFANGIVRVQLKTDVLNARSRAAIEKLGARYEGALRKHRQRPGRHVARYGVLLDPRRRMAAVARTADAAAGLITPI